jgi:hypothetical protein
VAARATARAAARATTTARAAARATAMVRAAAARATATARAATTAWLEALRAPAEAATTCVCREGITRVWRRRVEDNGLRAFGTGCYYEPVLKVTFSTGS